MIPLFRRSDLTGGPEIRKPIHNSKALIPTPYTCPKCRKVTLLTDWDIWGKVIRCSHCTTVLMDNRQTPPPPDSINPNS